MSFIVHEISEGNRYEQDSYLCCFRCDYCGRKEKETFDYVYFFDKYDADLGFCTEECLLDWEDKIASGKTHDPDQEWIDNHSEW